MATTTTEYESIRDAAVRYAISHRTIRRLIQDGTLNAISIPGARVTRVRKSEVDALFRPVTSGA